MPPKDRNTLLAASVKQAPTSPTAKGTAKYTNKDGSKFITVPKTSASTESSRASPTTAAPGQASNLSSRSSGSSAVSLPTQPVNRKKQKRREKAAAKLAAEQGLDLESANGPPSPRGPSSHVPKPSDFETVETDDEDADGYPRNNYAHAQENGYADPADSKPKKTKKKKRKNNPSAPGSDLPASHHHHVLPPPPPSGGPASIPHDAVISKEKIWNTSSQEERQRIKQFWLGLGEDERKSLVKVEKDAVLKKMKEQQKHTCSCTVCGRKRIAIEEELEGLYDAYYEELEQFANQPNRQGEGPPMMGSPRNYGPVSGLRRSRSLSYSRQQPSVGRIVEHVGDDEDDEGDEDYSEDALDDEEYSDEEQILDGHPRDYAQDFFHFGNSLTVQGGILTVADDLLKNDGKKFIEMMEQLAERRMAREEDVKDLSSRGYGHANGGAYSSSHSNNHAPAADEEEYEDEDDDEEDYESQEEEFDEEEQDTMTEEQRMEEGRRMFQIFAARMFEQRVLTAYREKVAKERQQKLLEELEEESRADSQRKAKKAKEAQKRKDKALQKKQAQAEEKARKDAEKAAEEQARLAEEQRKAEEQKARVEEKRRKKEAQKKAEEEERLRKEAERQRRIHEQKERQAEQERRAREAKEREKKTREDAKAKEKEARERREKEARERKEQQDRENREREARLKAEREAKELQRQEARAAQKAAAPAPMPMAITLAKRPSQHTVSSAVPALPREPSTGVASPQIPVATPALPKGPAAMRPRQSSQQDTSASVASSQGASQSGSVASQNPSPHPVTPVHTSPGPIGPSSKAGSSSSHSMAFQSSQATSPLHAAAKPVATQSTPFNVPPMPLPMPPGIPQIPPGFGSRVGHDSAFSPFAATFRPGQAAMQMPPGLGGPAIGRPFPVPQPPPGFSRPVPEQPAIMAPQYISKENTAPSHSRQPSAGFESVPSAPSNQSAIRPAPIGRPGSAVQGQRGPSGSTSAGGVPRELDNHHLGSSALLDDSDEPFQEFSAQRRGTAAAPGLRPAFSAPFAMSMEPIFSSPVWGMPSQGTSHPFGPQPPPVFGHAPVSGGWPAASPIPSAFGGAQGVIGRPNQPRSVAVRQMLCRACKDLSERESTEGKAEAAGRAGFFTIEDIKAQVDLTNPGEPVAESELLDMCDTEGNHLNGGGSFDVRRDLTGYVLIRWMSGASGSEASSGLQRAVGAPGEIGSPSVGTGTTNTGPGATTNAAASR